MNKKSKIYSELEYEIKMYRWTRQQIIDFAAGKIPTEDNLRYAIIEAFVAHVRLLINFFYPNQRIHHDDVLAKHFIENWDDVRPPISELLQKAQTKANKQLAHLTYSRITKYGEIEEKRWGEIASSDELEKIINSFKAKLTEGEIKVGG